MKTTLPLSQKGESFLMSRTKLAFDQFNISDPAEQVVDRLVDQFNDTYRGQLTIDELLLHPREALLFCDAVRSKNGWFSLPDDMILRPILTRRKNPNQ